MARRPDPFTAALAWHNRAVHIQANTRDLVDPHQASAARLRVNEAAARAAWHADQAAALLSADLDHLALQLAAGQPATDAPATPPVTSSGPHTAPAEVLAAIEAAEAAHAASDERVTRLRAELADAEETRRRAREELAALVDRLQPPRPDA
jgi:hypothetical protein